MRKIFLYITFLLCFASYCFARPISYSDGYTAMQYNDHDKNSLHLHYSPTYRYSVGYKGEYFRKQQIALNGIQLNNLLKRFNAPSSQANIYLKSSIGNANRSSLNALYGFTGIAADFETRKYFISYENRYYKSGKSIISQFEQSLQVGFAPVVKNYGNIHSWIMLKVYHQPASEDNFIATPMVRVFKGLHLAEIGVSSDKRILFNYILRF